VHPSQQRGVVRVLGISGSLRAESSNAALLRAAAALAPRDMRFDFYDEQIGGLPHFNPDLDAEGAAPPPPVGELRRVLGAADGVLISTPEYAHGIPGALKNALDWIVSSGELEHKPVVLIVASPSGGEWARASLVPTLEVMGSRVVASLALTFTRTFLDTDGNLSDPDIAQNLRASLEALASAIDDRRAAADG
jgi:chromate reductase, NAD(P)H dehydrogenase (quinone)